MRTPLGIYFTSGKRVDQIIHVSDYVWYVDSVSGSDSNDGGEFAPFKTIAKLMTVWQAGQSVGLAKGSTWREELLMPGNSSSVYAYGSGSAPILDASEIAANASWTKTGGLTNVYQITVTLPTRAGETNWVNVWEDDAYLTNRASTALVDANAGSYYVSGTSGSVTIYVHATDSSDVTANGKVYTYSARIAGAYWYDYSNCTLNGIKCQKNLCKDGSIKGGQYSTITNCDAYYGSGHNIFFRTGSTLTNVYAKYCYWSAVPTMFIGNDNTPNNEGLTLTGCTADATASGASVAAVGFYNHANTSGGFGSVTYTTCTAIGCYYGFQCANTTTITCTGCITSTCTQYGYDLSAAGVNWIIDQAYHVIDAVSGFAQTQAAFSTGTFSITNSTISARSAPHSGFVRFQSNAVLTSTGNNWTLTTNSGFRQIYGAAIGFTPTVNASGNDYNLVVGTVYVMGLFNGASTVVSDNNTFSQESIRNLLGSEYTTITAWKAAGYDTHSTVG